MAVILFALWAVVGRWRWTDDTRERAWVHVHSVIAPMPGWVVGPATHHGEGESWHVAAIDLRPRGRQAKREAIKATGPTEIAALGILAALLGDRDR